MVVAGPDRIFLLVAVELLFMAFFVREIPWLWMLPTSLALFYWFLEDEKIALQGTIADLLDATAHELRFANVSPNSANEPR